jgi:hypothetical protein
LGTGVVTEKMFAERVRHLDEQAARLHDHETQLVGAGPGRTSWHRSCVARAGSNGTSTTQVNQVARWADAMTEPPGSTIGPHAGTALTSPPVRMGPDTDIRSGDTPSCDHLYRIGSNDPWERGLRYKGMRMVRAMAGWRWPTAVPAMLVPLPLASSDGVDHGAI